MNQLNTLVYAGNSLGPANIAANTNDVYASGFSTILLGLFHIGRGPDAKDPVKGQKTGDLVFNNPNDPNDPGLILISDGALVGPPTWLKQLQQLFSANSGKGSVTQMGCSVGGGGCEDYQTIWGNFIVNGSIGSDTALFQNFVTLKKVCPFIEFIDFDCEEFDSSYYSDFSWTETVIAFGNMLKKIGFSMTLCPYIFQTDWMDILKSLYVSSAPTVVWMNLQCYDGGGGNDPGDWANAVNGTNLGIDGASFTVPGLWCCNTAKPYDGSTPPAVESQFATWKQTTALQGGFMWNYDDILANQSSTACNPKYTGSKSAAAYEAAMVKGLNS
jgi:hypothetical protein